MLLNNLRHSATVNDMAYHRRNRQFESRLAIRRDELQAATVTRDETGRVVISALPAYSFPTQDCAEQMLVGFAVLGLFIIKYGHKREGQ